MGGFGDAFLQTYMQANAQRAAQQQQARQFAFENMWNAQKQQIEQQRLDAENTYRSGMLKREQDLAQADINEKQLNALTSGRVVQAQPMQPAPLTPQAAPPSPDGQPAAPSLDSLPSPQSTVNPVQRSGAEIAPPGAVPLGNMMLRPKTAQELQQEQQGLQDTQSHHVQAGLDQLKAAGLISPQQHQTMSALTGLQAAIGHPLNEAEASVIAPKPGAVKAGDEPLGGQSDAINKMTLDRLKVLDPTITAVPSHMLTTPTTTKNEYATIHQNLQGIEAAKAAVANAKTTAEDRAARLALSQQLAGLAQGREQDRIDTENEKLIGPARNAASIAHTYIDGKDRTGVGDETLYSAYANAMREQGQRGSLSPAMLKLQQSAQSAADKGRSMWNNLVGGTLFSEDLRKQMVQQIDSAYEAKQQGLQHKGQAAPTPAAHVVHWGRDAQGNPVPLP